MIDVLLAYTMKGWVMIILKLFLVVPLILSASCHAGPRAINPKTLDVFRDFALAGQGPAKFESDGSLDVTYIVPHGEVEESRPEQVQTQVQYIFHNRGPIDDERLGSQDLPTRLRELGFKVLEAPKFNGGQFSYPYIGGPYFSITFMDGDHKGVIFNRVHGENAHKNLMVEDYILVFVP
jgi:hypothetical protein